MSLTPIVAAASLAAAAAAVLLWFLVRPTAQLPSKEVILAIGPAHYERATAWPDFVVRLDEGRLSIRVGALTSDERFRVTTLDSEIEVRGAKFVVGAEHSHISFVFVGEGHAEIRWSQQPPVFVAAGQTWMPPRIAHREALELTPLAPTNIDAPPPTSPASIVASTAKSGLKKPSHTTNAAPQVTTSRAADETKPASPTTKIGEAATKPRTPTPPAPAEADFRAGVAALRAGDATRATRSFASACAAAQGDALAEDACFWVGAAAKRAGDTKTAREALTRFLASFPGSARMGEASALLGWILYDAGELDAARARFEVAARDRVPKVKESAERGLQAITRTRASK